jgi:hypothetical protein
MRQVVHGVNYPWGELSMGRVSMGRIVYRMNCLLGRIVRGECCPWGELSMGRVVPGVSCPLDDSQW